MNQDPHIFDLAKLLAQIVVREMTDARSGQENACADSQLIEQTQSPRQSRRETKGQD